MSADDPPLNAWVRIPLPQFGEVVRQSWTGFRKLSIKRFSGRK